MSITYIGHSQAKDGQSDHLRNFFETVVIPAVRSSPGNKSCTLLQNQDDPHQFMVIEVWTSVEAHRASIQNISSDSIAQFMALVVAPPKGGYYTALG